MQKGLWTRQYLNNTELSPSKPKKERKNKEEKCVDVTLAHTTHKLSVKKKRIKKKSVLM